MEVNFPPEVQAQLERVAEESGCASAELVQDAVAGMLNDLASAREMLDRRYDEMKSGAVKMIDGEEAFRILMDKATAKPKRKQSA